MSEWPRTFVALAAAFAGVTLTTLLIGFVIMGDRDPAVSGQPQGSASVPPNGDAAEQPAATTDIGGALTFTGDRTGTLLLDREGNEERYTLQGSNGRVAFDGQPATISRLRLDELEFYLDPGDCGYTPGDRDPETGLAPLDVDCRMISDIRDSAVVTVEGTIRLPADQLGLRGDLPQTGGRVAVGDETLTFDEASMDLRRPEVIETRPGFSTRNPVVYPVSVSSPDATLEYEYDWNHQELRLLGVDLGDRRGDVGGDGCRLGYQRIGDVSPRVTVFEMTLDCPEVDVKGGGIVSLAGAIVIDVANPPPTGLR